MTGPEKRYEIEQNYCVFLDKLPFILPMYRDQYALMRHGEIVGYYSTLQDAYITGQKFYEDKLYSIQKVTDIPVDLGFFSHAKHSG